MAEFTKKAFAHAVKAKYGLSLVQAGAIFDDIGDQMHGALKAGATVHVFGLVTLKVTKGIHGNRLRARSTAHYEREAGHGIYSARPATDLTPTPEN